MTFDMDIEPHFFDTASHCSRTPPPICAQLVQQTDDQADNGLRRRALRLRAGPYGGLVICEDGDPELPLGV